MKIKMNLENECLLVTAQQVRVEPLVRKILFDSLYLGVCRGLEEILTPRNGGFLFWFLLSYVR